MFTVGEKKTYLLRIINAALNNDYWFSVANHKVTVVGADGNYLKPFSTQYLPISPGQTTDVLLTTDQKPGQACKSSLNFWMKPCHVLNHFVLFTFRLHE